MDGLTIFITLLSSILGGLVGGLFTFIGVHLTHKFEMKKLKIESLMINKDKAKQIIEARPEFDIVNSSKEVDLKILMCPVTYDLLSEKVNAYYDKEYFIEKDYDFIEVTLRNIGVTIIDHFFFNCNDYRFSIIEKGSEQVLFLNNIFNNNILCDKKIKQNDEYKIKIYYNKNYVNEAELSSLMVYMKDVNGRFWEQLINYPNRSEKPLLIFHEKFFDAYRMDSFYEYLQDKIYWIKFNDKLINRDNNFENILHQNKKKQKKMDDRNEKYLREFYDGIQID